MNTTQCTAMLLAHNWWHQRHNNKQSIRKQTAMVSTYSEISAMPEEYIPVKKPKSFSLPFLPWHGRKKTFPELTNFSYFCISVFKSITDKILEASHCLERVFLGLWVGPCSEAGDKACFYPVPSHVEQVRFYSVSLWKAPCRLCTWATWIPGSDDEVTKMPPTLLPPPRGRGSLSLVL